MAKNEKLEVSEQSDIYNAICNKLKEHCKIKVQFDSLEKNNACIGVFSQQGSVYLKKFITGSFIGLVPCLIVYRNYPKSDAQRMQMIEYINKLAEWLCKRENYPLLAENREIERIEQLSAASRTYASEDGTTDYAVSIQVKYRKDDD